MSQPLSRKQKTYTALVLVFFGLLYADISFVNHYFFRTAAYDLGIYQNAIYSYAHFHINHATLQYPEFNNVLADHFEPIFMLFSPLYWLFGSYTLLVIQVALVLLGGWGIFKLILISTSKYSSALWAMVHFFTIWGIYSALAFDFHNNVTAACILPWLLYFFRQKKWRASWLLFFLMLISKENMALWTSFIMAALAVHYRRDKKVMLLSSVMAVIAFSYAVIVIKVIIPSLTIAGRPYAIAGLYAESLGYDSAGILNTLFTKPLYVFKLFFINQQNLPEYDWIKTEFYVMFLVSGGIFLFYYPHMLLMLLPVFAQKMFMDSPTRWGINYQYSIEFAPVIAIGTALFLNRFVPSKKILPVFACLVSSTATIYTMKTRISVYYDEEKARFLSASHYTRPGIDIPLLHSDLQRLIPAEAKISVHSHLAPHLAHRDTLYTYPVIGNAEYIILQDHPSFSPYPLLRDEYTASVRALAKNPEWAITYWNNGLMIFERRK